MFPMLVWGSIKTRLPLVMRSRTVRTSRPSSPRKVINSPMRYKRRHRARKMIKKTDKNSNLFFLMNSPNVFICIDCHVALLLAMTMVLFKFVPEFKEVDKTLNNYVEISSGTLSLFAWVMIYSYLNYLEAGFFGFY